MLPPIWCHIMVCTHSGQQLQADQQSERERQTSCLVCPEDHAYAERSVPSCRQIGPLRVTLLRSMVICDLLRVSFIYKLLFIEPMKNLSIDIVEKYIH